MKLWHRRLGHLSTKELVRIHKSGLVDGFKVSGPLSKSCRCDTCRQSRLRRVSTPREREYLSTATFVCHTVSADTKDLPYVSFRGHRYVIIWEKLEFSRMLTTLNGTSIGRKKTFKKMFSQQSNDQSKTTMLKQVTGSACTCMRQVCCCACCIVVRYAE